jgi:hypothetical protein
VAGSPFLPHLVDQTAPPASRASINKIYYGKSRLRLVLGKGEMGVAGYRDCHGHKLPELGAPAKGSAMIAWTYSRVLMVWLRASRLQTTAITSGAET